MSQCQRPEKFTAESKTERLVSFTGETTTFEAVLKRHRGKKILIDIWASWCKDCVVRFPNLKQLQKEFPQVSFVFLSQDRTQASWRKAVNYYGLLGDHYFMPEEKKGPLGNFLNLWWIPRYVVVDELGNITLFKATKITDNKIREALKK